MYLKPLFVCCLLLAACSAPVKPEEVQEAKVTADSLAATEERKPLISDCNYLRREARKTDSVLLTETEVNLGSANKAIRAFTDLAQYCPQDSMSAMYLIKTAQVAQAIHNVPQAKTALDKCIADYPNFKDRPAAMFLLAQLYDEVTYLNNEEQAKVLYQQIVDEYPKSPWAANAKSALSFIGKTDAEIIKEFEKKNKK